MGKFSKDNIKTYRDFRNLAHTIINNSLRPKLRKFALRDIDRIITAINTAYLKYSPDLGKWSTWVRNAVVFEVLTIMNEIKKQQKFQKISFHKIYQINYSDKNLLSVDNKDWVDNLKTKLSDRDFDILYQHVVENRSFLDMSKTMNESKSGLAQKFTKIINRIKEIYGVKNA